jgi:hypothetical protein
MASLTGPADEAYASLAGGNRSKMEVSMGLSESMGLQKWNKKGVLTLVI